MRNKYAELRPIVYGILYLIVKQYVENLYWSINIFEKLSIFEDILDEFLLVGEKSGILTRY